MIDTTIIERCREGDREAFAELFRAYGPRVRRIANHVSGNATLADDITQEVFIRCFKYIKTLKAPEKFDSWLYRTTVTVCWLMHRTARTDSLDELAEEGEEPQADGADLSVTAEAGETKALLQAAIRELSLPLRTVVVLFYYEDRSIKEIAAILGCFDGTVKSRLHNAKSILKRKVRRHFESIKEVHDEKA